MFGAKRRREQAIAREIGELMHAITLPALSRVTGTHRIVVVGAKGGVGKTTAAAAISLALSELRGETVAALDANPDSGTLRRRLVSSDAPMPAAIIGLAVGATRGTVPPEWPSLARYCDLVGRLRVFSNEGADRVLVEAMSGDVFSAALGLVSRAAQLVVCDMGTSVTSSLGVAALDAADSLVIATDLDRADLDTTVAVVSALAGQPLIRPGTPDYAAITDGRYADLIARAVVVVAPSRIDADPAEFAPHLDWLGQACAAVVVPPRDPVLSTARIQWDWLLPTTKREYLRALALIAERFPADPISHTRAARAAICSGQHAGQPTRTLP